MKRLTVAARDLFAIAMLVSTLVAVSAPPAAGLGAPVVDQEFTSPNNLDALINGCCRFSAQTFTAGPSGVLVGINIDVHGTGSSHLHVAIRTVAAGAPTATILGETTLSSSSAPLSQLISFPQTINITAGVQYAIVVDYPDAPPPGSGQVQGLWAGAVSDVYLPGRALASCDFIGCVTPGAWFESLVGADQHFRTYVAARLPVPTTPKDCKNGGWRNVADDHGVPFRNQGQCVSFVVRAHRAT
jgi:hypothetical protein